MKSFGVSQSGRLPKPPLRASAEGFAATVKRVATEKGLSIGDYAVARVGRFARDGREGEMRAVASAMAGSQVPVLAGLEQILWLDLADMT